MLAVQSRLNISDTQTWNNYPEWISMKTIDAQMFFRLFSG